MQDSISYAEGDLGPRSKMIVGMFVVVSGLDENMPVIEYIVVSGVFG